MNIFTPTIEQQNIIDHFTGHAIVVAGPGSGKTTTLIAHVKKLINERNIPKNDIWIMAFNRDISSKLKEGIQNELKAEMPQITTIHTFILKQTFKHGAQLLDGFEIADGLGECGKDNLLWKLITSRLKEKHGIDKTSKGTRLDVRHVRGKLWDDLRDYWLTSNKPNNDLFDKFNYEIERLKTIYRVIFLDELAIKFLDALKSNPSFMLNVHKPRIIIDEFQDLNPTEHGIIQQFHQEGTTFIVFGDDDQAVYGFRWADAANIHNFTKIYKPKQYRLPRNRRCPKEILDLADEFVKGLPRLKKLAGYASHRGRVDILNFRTDEDEQLKFTDVINKYLVISPQCNDTPQILILCGSKRISKFVKSLKDVGINGVTGDKKEDPLDNDWGLAFKSLTAILVKGFTPMNIAAFLSITNPSLMKKVNEHIEEEEHRGNPVDFLRAASDLRKNNSKLEKLLSDIEDLNKAVLGDNFDPNIVFEFIPGALDGKDEAEPLIIKVWEESKQESSNDSETDCKKVSKGEQFLSLLENYISEKIRKSDIGRVHVTTYRKSKGLEADLVIITSVDSIEFFSDAQKRRLLYVAATRTKKNLILTFADKRTGSRRYARGRNEKSQGVPKVFRSPLIPSNYPTLKYSEEWLKNWKPL